MKYVEYIGRVDKLLNLYSKEYYQSYCGLDYSEKSHWEKFFGGIADKIVQDFNPKTVLDAGCAWGYLVAALRDRGVNAYGIDISRYAIDQVREDIKPFCAVSSLLHPLPEDFPQFYDLVTSIEVIEHLYEEDGLEAIKKLCTYADRILISSTPDDIMEKTHFNVQQPEYWVKHFAKHGFYNQVNYIPNYISKASICFERSQDFSRVVENYERDRRIIKQKAEILNQEPQGFHFTSFVYFETDIGFSIDSSIQILTMGNHFDEEIILPHTSKIVRFDPIDGQACIVKNLEAVSASGILECQNVNGYQFGEYHIFLTKDPQFLLFPHESNTWIKLEAQIYPFDEIILIGLLSQLQRQLKYSNQISSSNTEYLSLIKNLTEESKNTKLQLEQDIQKLVIEIQSQEMEHRLALETLQNQRQTEIERLHVRNQAAIEKLQLEHEASISELRSEDEKLLVDMQLKHKKSLADMKAEHEKSLVDMKAEHEKSLAEIQADLAHYKTHYHYAIQQRDDYRVERDSYLSQFNALCEATLWKMTKPLRLVLDGIKAILKSNSVTRVLYKGLVYLRRNGVRSTWNKTKLYIKSRKKIKKMKFSFAISDHERETLTNMKFFQDVKFSVLVPLYNTPEVFLKEMIQSVTEQTYGNWELCLADGSDDSHPHVKKMCESYAQKDNRIRYKKLLHNEGISKNTNCCVEMATGNYFALLDHDDLLHPTAFFEIMKAICEENADFIYTDENTFKKRPSDAYCPHFKQDFAPDTLRSYNYICHLSVFSRELLMQAGMFDSQYDGSQDYDMILRLTEKAKSIVHIPKTLYYWRAHQQSVAAEISAKPYTIAAAKAALTSHLERVGLEGAVEDAEIPSTYKFRYKIQGNPKISILIPNKDLKETLQKCIESILSLTTYQNYEIVIIENNSVEPQTFEYYEQLKHNTHVRVVVWNGSFNFSSINNFGVKYAGGEYILFLNNDMEVITPGWLEEMLMFAQRSDVGAVGAKLYYPDNSIQHAGVILGIGGIAGHSHKYFPGNDSGYMMRLKIVQNLSAVTGACMMLRKEVFRSISGFDENFAVAFNDVDLCMRIREKGYLIVFTPFAELYHYESKSRGFEDTPEKQTRFAGEISRFQERWGTELANGDPYYNPNFTLCREDFSFI